jgi:hypothetical protein
MTSFLARHWQAQLLSPASRWVYCGRRGTDMSIGSTTMEVTSNGKTLRITIRSPMDDEDIVIFLRRDDAMKFADCLYDMISKMSATPEGRK